MINHPAYGSCWVKEEKPAVLVLSSKEQQEVLPITTI